MEENKGVKAIRAASRKVWRNWLAKNNTRETKVWLIIYRRGNETRSVSYADAVEEALCFGWIDSTANPRDDNSHYQYFAKRKSTSKWSKLNRERVNKLTEAGLMTPEGQAMIDLAKKTGTWLALEKVQVDSLPDDLQKAFLKSKKALANYTAFPPSSKRVILEWILNAKRPETRSARIKETVSLAAQNLRANHYRQKGV